MRINSFSFLKITIYVFLIALLVIVPVVAVWASTLTEEEVKVWKMWINLAKNGYAEPMNITPPTEKPWWKFWE